MSRIGDLFEEDDTQKLPRRGTGEAILILVDEAGNKGQYQIKGMISGRDPQGGEAIEVHVEGDVSKTILEKA